MGSLFSAFKSVCGGARAPVKAPTELDVAIEAFVNKMMEEDDDRIPMLPAQYEKKLYKKMCKFAVLSIKDVCDSTKIEIMGQRITINVKPIVAEEEENN
jgi:hypothetical protein